MKAHFCPIVKKIWQLSLMNCLYCLAFGKRNSLPLGPILVFRFFCSRDPWCGCLLKREREREREMKWVRKKGVSFEREIFCSPISQKRSPICISCEVTSSCSLSLSHTTDHFLLGQIYNTLSPHIWGVCRYWLICSAVKQFIKLTNLLANR